MSNLNKLLEKLAGAPEEPSVEAIVGDDNSVTDPLYVEKLAAAVDYLVETEFKEAAPDQPQVSQEKNSEPSDASKEEVKLESSQDSKAVKSKKVKSALLRKLKGTGVAPKETVADEGEEELGKAANIAKVQALMAKGMDPKSAIRAAYPNMSDEEVNALAVQLSKSTAPKEAPKEGPAEEKTASLGLVESMRSALKTKLSSREEVKTDSFIEAVLSKLETMNTPSSGPEKIANEEETEEEQEQDTAEEESEETSEEEETTSDEPEAESVEESEEESAEEEAGGETKESSDNRLTLANMLKEANSKKTEDAVESTPSTEDTETAAVQDFGIANLLRNSILSKVNRAEV